MSLPHFDIITFPGQILWLFIATGGSYVFNKFFFLPYLSNAIQKRNDLILNCSQEIERMNEHAKSLRVEINEFSKKAKNDSKAIIENALHKSQSMLIQNIKKNNEVFHSRAIEYEKHISKQKENLVEDLHIIVSDVKSKAQSFIASQHY